MSVSLQNRLRALMAAAPACACRSFSTAIPATSRNNPRSRSISILDIPKKSQHIFQGRQEYEYPLAMATTGERLPGYVDGITKKFVYVKELIPELVVPDLTDFKLKAYVSYKAPDTVELEYSARDLFDAVYGQKLKEDFEKGKLGELVAETEQKARLGLLKTHTYDKEPPRMLDTDRVIVTEKR